MKPVTSGISVAFSIKMSPLIMSLPILPKMRGTTIRKENRAAFSLSIPNKTEVDIVAPERETPGNIAMACATPMMSAWKNLTFLFVFLAYSFYPCITTP